MHEAKGLATFFAPVHSVRFVELCVCQNSPGLCFPSSGKEQRCLGGRQGNSTVKQPCLTPGSYLLGLIKGLHYPVGSVNSLRNTSFGTQVCILIGVFNTSAYQGTWLAAGNFCVMVPCWTKANACHEQSSYDRYNVLGARAFLDL